MSCRYDNSGRNFLEQLYVILSRTFLCIRNASRTFLHLCINTNHPQTHLRQDPFSELIVLNNFLQITYSLLAAPLPNTAATTIYAHSCLLYLLHN